MKQIKRKFTIIGNWKMNPDTIEEARKIFSAISRTAVKNSKVAVVIAPPTPFISILSGKKIHICAQDVAMESRGAYTGSVSARQVESAGAEYTIVGHSERRAAGDTDEIIAKKTAEALEANLRVVLCVGEKGRDNHANYLREVRGQLITALSLLPDKRKIQWVTVAYEPVWAVGKGYDTALRPSDIHEMTIYIKKIVSEILGKKVGLKIPVLYGGSLNSENAEMILKDGFVDGLLVGRQSLDAQAFGKIIEYANKPF